MTTTAHPDTRPGRPAAPTDLTSGMRTLMRVDAAFCAALGGAGALAAPAVAELLGPDVSSALVRIVGVALLVWAIDAALLSRTSGRLLVGAVAAAAVGNVAWELATLVLIATGTFSTGGAVTVVAVAAIAGALGLLQVRAVLRQRATTR